MAKAPAKKSALSKKTVTETSKSKPSSVDTLEKVSIEVVKKLQSLGIEKQLQADLEWCLGSYRHDKNPTGLLDVIGQSIVVLKAEQAKKTKGVTVKLITDLEKIYKTQN